jgi:hypothetical protein
MHLIISFAFILFFVSGCTTTATYTREGYKLANEQSLPKTCDIPIKFQMNNSEKTVLGVIESHEPVMGTHCHEEMVLNRFRQEGCYIGANLINVIKERQPDYFFRACYQATAELVKVKGSYKSDAKYESEPLHKRSMISHQKAIDANARAVGAGIDGGLGATRTKH